MKSVYNYYKKSIILNHSSHSRANAYSYGLVDNRLESLIMRMDFKKFSEMAVSKHPLENNQSVWYFGCLGTCRRVSALGFAKTDAVCRSL